MTKTQFMRDFERASLDPIIVFARIGHHAVDSLLWGDVSDRAWNALCRLQAWRYRQLLRQYTPSPRNG